MAATDRPATLSAARERIEKGQYAEAEGIAREVLAIIEARQSPDSVEVADALDVLVRALWRGGKANDKEVLGLTKRAVAIREAMPPGSDQRGMAVSLRNLAQVIWQQGRPAEAEPILARVLAIRQKIEPGSLAVARVLENLANLHSELGQYEKAETRSEQALAIAMETPEGAGRDQARNLHSLAFLYGKTGRWDKSRKLYRRALDMARVAYGSEHPYLVWILNNQGILLDLTGDYEGARRAYEQALQVAETLPRGHPLRASVLNNFGLMHRNIGDYRSARSYYEQVMEMRSGEPDHPETAATLNNLGELDQMTGDCGSAREFYEKSLAIREKVFGASHPAVATSLVTLAILLTKMEDYAPARPLFDRALTIWNDSVDPGNPDLGWTMSGLAALLEETGEYGLARRHFEGALENRKAALGPGHPAVARSEVDVGRLLARMGESPAALEAAVRAETIARDHVRLTVRTLPERQALRYASVRASGLGLALTLAVQGLEPGARRRVWDALIRSRAIVLDEMAHRHSIVGWADDPALARLVEELAVSNRRLAQLVVRGTDTQHPESYRTLVEKARKEKERAERALAGKSVLFRDSQARKEVGLDAVAANLPEDSALVAFVLYDSPERITSGTGGPDQRNPRGPKRECVERPRQRSYVAFLLPGKKAAPVVMPLGRSDEIDGLISVWTEEAAGGVLSADRSPEEAEAAYRAAGEAVRRKIWDPITAKLERPGRVFIVPDGALHLVNLAALPVGRNEYLLETGPLFHYLSGERDLVPPRRSVPRGNGLLVLGGVEFDAASSSDDVTPAPAGVGKRFRGEPSACADFRSITFRPLPASAREASEIAAIWKQARGRLGEGKDPALIHLTNEEANEAAFKALAPGRRVLHLATHGFFLGGRCPAATDGARGVGKLTPAHEPAPPPPVGENPLRLSGLALAGANLRATIGPEEEDGVLTAEEIGAMDLSGVEWAVLSACDTAVGEVRAGEGVLGLRRAFQVSGARTVIMSLWQVEDRTAREWMAEVYEGHFLKGWDTARAVREASLAVLRARKEMKRSTHPFFWGGWVAAGDWR